MAFLIAENKVALSELAAEYFVNKAQQAIQQTDRFRVCMSGGSTPKAMFERLSQEPFRDQIDWSKVFVFWGDERNVPLDHEDSNFLMVKNALLNHIPIPESQVFPINGGLEAKLAADQYEQTLRGFFGQDLIEFDLVWLGMGDDGHTASLFPFTTVVDDQSIGVRAVWVEKLNTHRITLTATLINQAKAVAFLISGDGKAAALQSVINGPLNPAEFPSQLIARADRSIDWLLDRPAIAELDPPIQW